MLDRRKEVTSEVFDVNNEPYLDTYVAADRLSKRLFASCPVIALIASYVRLITASLNEDKYSTATTGKESGEIL